MRRDKPPAISNGEKQAALYNIACCYSRQGSLENSVRALASALPCTLSGQSMHPWGIRMPAWKAGAMRAR